MSSRLKEGEDAPDFTLPAQDGKDLSLHDYLGKKNVVLYFYPKDFTAGCTAETRKFGESHADLLGLGAEVIGISSDSTESHLSFAKECGVNFPLVSDVGRKVRELYGVRPSMGLVPGRVTFVIDKKGIIRRIFASQLNPKKHVSEALDALKKLD